MNKKNPFSNNFFLVLAVILVVLVFWCVVCKSSFGEIIGMNKSYSCEKDNRLYPSGKISGDYLNLNKYERDKLMVEFIKNGS
jgi:hypothetical protein